MWVEEVWRREVSTLLVEFGQEDGKKSKPWENTRLHRHNTTNNTSTKQPTPTKKIGTAKDENRKTMTPTQDVYALTESLLCGWL